MKVIARQSTDSERGDFEALLASDPALRSEFQRLQADVRLAKELVPLAEATTATTGELPPYARGRLQTKVRQTLGRPKTKSEESGVPETSLLLRWRRWLGLAFVVAVVGLVVIPPLLGPRRPAILLAMLDTAGATRGATNEAGAMLTKTWTGSNVREFAQDAELKAWEADWPDLHGGFVVKIIYDRPAGEIRVVGRSPTREFKNTFTISTDLDSALALARNWIERETHN